MKPLLIRRLLAIHFLLFFLGTCFGQEKQRVEGFDSIVFHFNANRFGVSKDFRGVATGYMTAGWWNPGQMKEDNILSWKTANVPEKKPTTFCFVGAGSVVPAEFSRGPFVKMFVNGHYVLTFQIGYNRSFTWKEGDYELKYISKRVEYPFFGSHRQTELNGNSGVYELTVPAKDVVAGKPVVLKVQLVPFAQWHNGWFMVKERRDVLKQSEETLEEELETLRQDVALVNAQTQVLATKVYSDLLNAARFRHEVIYQNGFRHLHPADLIKLKNGELLLMAREATEHYSADGDVVLLRSKDGGKTWGNKQTVGAIKGMDEREGCGIQLKDGTIVVGIFYNGNYNSDGSYGNYFNPKTQKFEPEQRDKSKPTLGTYIITSKDNGHTWTEPAFIDITNIPVTGLEGPTDAPIELPDGSIVMGVIGYGLNKNPNVTGSIMLRSLNKGRTWQYLSVIASDTNKKWGGFVEPGIVRTKTGRIVAALRNAGPDNAVWITFSDDDGKTWAPVRKTDMIGHPVDLIQLTDGRLMASYGIRTGPHYRPGGVRACFSNDNGRTWDLKTEVQLRNDFLNWDVGYPESLEMPDGNILTMYYYNLFGKYYLGGTFWKP